MSGNEKNNNSNGFDSQPEYHSPYNEEFSHRESRPEKRHDLTPSSKDAEMAVLSCLITNAGSWNNVVSRLTDADFYFHENQIVFNALSTLLDAGDTIDVIMLSEYLKRDGTLTKIGDIKYLTQLKMLGASPEVVDSYITTVKDKSQLRMLQTLGQEMSSQAVANSDPTVLVEQLESQISKITQDDSTKKGGFESLGGSINRVIDKIDAMFDGEGDTYGVSTGFSELDHLTLGLQPADMVIIAGRPSMGKTTLAMNIAENAGMKGSKVGVFSLEMPTDALTMRMFSSLGRIDQHKLRTGQLDEEDWPRLTKAVSILNNIPIYIDDTPSISVSEFRARARRLHKEHGLDLIVIDYLQLMRATGKLVNNRTDEISEISRSIKAVAKELNIPIIALSQLNRSLEQRPNKRPVMSDLRESGAIEQDADLIMFVYRDEIYNEDSVDKGKAEIIIGKHRNGPIGMVPLLFEGQYTRFHDFSISSDATHDEYGQSGFKPSPSHQDAQPVDENYQTKDDMPFNMADPVNAEEERQPQSPSRLDSFEEDGLSSIPQDSRTPVGSDRDNY